MASGDQRAVPAQPLDGSGLRAAIVRTGWNAEIVDRLTAGAERGLSSTGIEHIEVVQVAGALELPLACQLLAQANACDVMVAVGAVIRGETTHYELVSEGASVGLQRVSLEFSVPIGFGLVTVENEAQANARSEGPGGHNVGEEAAVAAVELAVLARRLGVSTTG